MVIQGAIRPMSRGQWVLLVWAGVLALIAGGNAAWAAEGKPQPQSAAARKEAEMKAREDRARERCRANRGVDCDSQAGLKEWVMQERPRSEVRRERNEARRNEAKGN